MASRYSLGVDFGTLSVRMQRAVFRDETPDDITLEAPQLQESIRQTLPVVLEIDPEQRSVSSYGLTALKQMLEDGSAASFVHEFKPYVHRPDTTFAAADGTWVCDGCGVPCPPFTQSCGPCSVGLRMMEAAADADWLSEVQERAFLWTETLLRLLANDLYTRVFPRAMMSGGDWRLLAGVPPHWDTALRTRFDQSLAQIFHSHAVETVTDAEAALCYHLYTQPNLTAGLVSKAFLIVDIGAHFTQITRCRLHLDGGGSAGLEQTGYRQERFGGVDFDGMFAAYIAERLKITVQGTLPVALKYRGRELKEQFNNSLQKGLPGCQMTVMLNHEGVRYKKLIEIHQSDFEQEGMGGQLIRAFAVSMQKTARTMALDPRQVGAVLVIGGGANWYFVEKILRQCFPSAVIAIGSDPDQTVVKGLSLVPIMRARPLKIPATAPPRGPEPVAPPDQPVTPTSYVHEGSDIEPGEPVRMDIDLSPEQARRGGHVRVLVQGMPEEALLQPGVLNGQKFRFVGQGGRDTQGRLCDLVLKIKIVSDTPSAERVSTAPVSPKVADATTYVSLTRQEALRGCRKTVALGSLQREITIPAGVVHSGSKLRFEHKGSSQNGATGDLIVFCRIID